MFAKGITCPFCFESFTLDKIQYRCTNSNCTLERDEIYERYQGESTPQRTVFSPQLKKGMFGAAKVLANCPKCQRESHKRVCPHCHYALQHDAGETEECTIAVIGGRTSGKSIYIATLIHRLKNEVGKNFELSVMEMNDFSRNRYRNDFEIPLFKKKTLLQATDKASVDAKTKTPMVFRITFNDKGKRKIANLVLFDTAGEDMKSLDSLDSEARYICYADAIIFLLDPLQIDAVRDELGEKNLPPQVPDAEPVYIIGRLIELYEQLKQKKSGDLIKKPVAFALSKIDQLFPIIDPSSGLHHTGEHFGYLNMQDIESVHTEINSYVQSWMGANLDNIIRGNFAKSHYFGISSLGAAPSPDNRVETISSIRVEDPILWIFHEFGLIKSK